MIKLKTKSGRVSKSQLAHIVSGSMVLLNISFYEALGFSPEAAVIICGSITVADKAVGMYLRTVTSEPM